MTREQFEHAIRAAGAVLDTDSVLAVRGEVFVSRADDLYDEHLEILEEEGLI